MMLLNQTGAQICFKSSLALMEGVLAVVVIISLVAILFPHVSMSHMKSLKLEFFECGRTLNMYNVKENKAIFFCCKL